MEKKSGTRWVKVNKKPITDLTLPVEDLVDGEEYEFRVFAENEAGVGKPCEPIKVVAKDPFDVPGKPDRPVIAKMTKDSADLTWSPPASDGGSPITNYKVEMRKKGDKSWKPVPKSEGPETECTVPGLEEEQEYEFRVTAENKAGPGPPSDPTEAAKFGKEQSGRPFHYRTHKHGIQCAPLFTH